ncbi:MAG TPA: polysaccharide deacetylase family protein [Gemmatimonadaceae bacterium]|nr:polysaccharide deacetylase family protein [Gemmatimonadaceae bacterium]
MSAPDVFVTVDVEPDCPPFLWTWRGIDEGAPRLLALLASHGVPATFFTTGNVAQRTPELIRQVLADGHELASHGMTHRAFDQLDEGTARWEIDESARILRQHAPVRSFRAPYLRFPDAYLRVLEEAGFAIDASLAKYKRSFRAPRAPTTLRRIAASITSSALRLPAVARDRWLARLDSPVVLFVHPWEFVDLRRTRIRWDCRMGTGEHALDSLDGVIRFFAARGARFRRVDSLLDAPASP